MCTVISMEISWAIIPYVCVYVCVGREEVGRISFSQFFSLKTKNRTLFSVVWYKVQYNNLIALGVKLNFPLLIHLSELI